MTITVVVGRTVNIHVLNRILVILFCLLAAIFWTGLAFSVWAYPRPLGSGLRQMGTALASADPFGRILITLLSFAVVLVAFLILLSEFMPEAAAVVRLSQVSGGQAVVATEGLARLIKQEAERVPQVVSARPEVTSLGTSVDVTLEVRADPLIHAPSTVEEVCQAVRAALEERMGVSIRHLTVRLQPEPLGAARRSWPALAPEPMSQPTITVPAAGMPIGSAGQASSDRGEAQPSREAGL